MSRQTAFPKYQVLGVEVDALTQEQALRYITGWAADRAKPAAVAVKPYVEFIDRAQREPALVALLNNVELCLPDGVALQWAANFDYHSQRRWWNIIGRGASIVLRPSALADPIPERFSGITFTLKLIRACEQQSLSLFLVGSPHKSTIGHTATSLQRQFPKLQIIGTFPGRFSSAGERQLLEQLQELRPDIILIGMGFPRQEQLAERLAKQLGHGFLIGEGGSFDYRELGGNLRRAPDWVRRIGLEWLWRLGRQPQRLGRQLAIPRFIWNVWREKPRQTTSDLL